MKTALLAVTNLGLFAASTDLHGGRPLCAEVDKGACQCENGNQIDEYRSLDAKCFLGKMLLLLLFCSVCLIGSFFFSLLRHISISFSFLFLSLLLLLSWCILNVPSSYHKCNSFFFFLFFRPWLFFFSPSLSLSFNQKNKIKNKKKKY